MTSVKIIPKKEDTTIKNTTEKKDTKTGKKSTEQSNTIVLPGDILVESIDFLTGHGTYREGKKIYSKILGILRKKEHVISVIPLSGTYQPKPRDFIIGEVAYVGYSNWRVDFGHPNSATLPMSGVPEFIENGADLSKYYKRGDLLFAPIESVTKNMIIQISMKDKRARKLFGGKIINISPSKVPRVIGKEGTMIAQIKNKTGCIINVSQNGRIWIKGDNEPLATRTIKMVEKLSHKKGLTETISQYLDEEVKKMGTPKSKDTEKQ
ncbi:MAG: RNA-binding protein [Candidatus Aenigmarchaeota archaeon]|nr:RNA-binding protein [Candidatus Aenigmarchaeota archaeon]